MESAIDEAREADAHAKNSSSWSFVLLGAAVGACLGLIAYVQNWF